MYTVLWLRFILTWLRFFLPWLRVFPCFFLSCKANARVKLAKTGHGPHSSTLVVISVARLSFVLFYVLFVYKYVLPPGDNPFAVNQYIKFTYIACAFVVSITKNNTNCRYNSLGRKWLPYWSHYSLTYLRRPLYVGHICDLKSSASHISRVLNPPITLPIHYCWNKQSLVPYLLLWRQSCRTSTGKYNFLVHPIHLAYKARIWLR
jgi:hypothetical protein